MTTMKLPVFSVAATAAPAEHIREFAQRLFPDQDHEIIERGANVELRSKLGTVEIDVSRGGVWAADASRLWRFDPSLEKKRNLIAGPEAAKRSMEILKAHRVLPEIAGPFRLRSAKSAGAVTAFSPKAGAARQVIQEDTTVSYDVEVDISEYGLPQKAVPVVGSAINKAAPLVEKVAAPVVKLGDKALTASGKIIDGAGNAASGLGSLLSGGIGTYVLVGVGGFVALKVAKIH
jgi:hypothetical protein